MHERLRELSMAAWEAVERGDANPLEALISREPQFLEYLEEDLLRDLLNYEHYLGDAPIRARELSKSIREAAM